MTSIGKVLLDADFIGGHACPRSEDKHRTGIGVMVFLCGGCDAKHLAISTTVDGVRQTVTVHGEDADKLVSELVKGIASS